MKDSQEELGVTAHDRLDQSVSVSGLLGDGLAKSERVAAGLVGSEVEVMSGDSCYKNS
jgi:hypothetical protein